MKKPGIHLRLLFGVIVLISATTFMLGYMGTQIIREFIQSRFDERFRFLAKYLALNAEIGILVDERTMLNRFAKNLLSEKDVIRVRILNIHNEIMADESKKMAGQHFTIESPVYLRESLEESQAFHGGKTGNQKEELIGKVQITYSTEGIIGLLSTMKFRFLWISAGIAGLAVLIFYFISRSLVAPITELVQAVRKVTQGNLTFRVLPKDLPETRELAIAFNAMLDSLEQSRKALEKANQEMIRQKTLAEMGKFSMMIAHEVKNPLSIIKSSLDILKKEVPSDNIMVAYIEDEIKRLNRLIEDFLLFSRPAVPMFRNIDANALLKENISRFEMQLSASSVVIRVSIPESSCYVSADSDLLVRAIDNILKNAFEASGNTGVIHITSSCPEDKWIVKIEDEGTGIPDDHIDRIFEPFFTTRAKGTGLGLAYASQVIQGHGGAIAAFNRKEGGAKFIIELPVITSSDVLF